MIKKEIILVEDIMKTSVVFMRNTDTISDIKEKVMTTGHGKFPILDNNNKFIGMISVKDIATDLSDNESVTSVMIKNPITVTPLTSVAYTAHMMTWENVELIPVVEDKVLVGVVSRHDIIKALQHVNNQPHVAETIDDIILKNFSKILILELESLLMVELHKLLDLIQIPMLQVCY
jgi:predicted transcriptional regulator